MLLKAGAAAPVSVSCAIDRLIGHDVEYQVERSQVQHKLLKKLIVTGIVCQLERLDERISFRTERHVRARFIANDVVGNVQPIEGRISEIDLHRIAIQRADFTVVDNLKIVRRTAAGDVQQHAGNIGLRDNPVFCDEAVSNVSTIDSADCYARQ